MTQKNYYKHIVAASENFLSVAKKYKIDPNELKAFHNELASDFYKVHSVAPHSNQYVPYIYIPVAVHASYLKTIVFNKVLHEPETFSATTYGVICTNKTKNEAISYTMRVEKAEINHYVLEQSKVLLNGNELNKVYEQFVQKVAKVLYPLELKATQTDGIVEILNTDAIQSRWHKATSDLNRYYKGDFIEKIMQKLSLFFNEPNAYIAELEYNMFYFFYFFPIYQNYTKGDVKFGFPLGFANILGTYRAKAQLHLQQELTNTGFVFLQINGSGIDEIENRTCTFNMHYKLHPTTNKICTIKGHLSFTNAEQNTDTYTLEVYELKNTTI